MPLGLPFLLACLALPATLGFSFRLPKIARTRPARPSWRAPRLCVESAEGDRRSFLTTTAHWAALAAVAWQTPWQGAAAAAAALGRLQVLGEVEKSPNDSRLYCALVLENGLRVLVVSDSDVKSGAAAMDVHVGHFSDPADLAGLAHATEHMLFLGTQKFPDEAEYSSFLSGHGGSSNAYTATEDTCYYFDVGADYLEGALDRFSEFFKSPQFTPSATERELNAIDSEDAKNQQSDGFRAYQLEKGRANPAHPYSKFGTGNRRTLAAADRRGGLQAALREFFDRYYSANQMTLCIVGKQPLDELQRWAVTYFSAIPNKNIPPPADAWLGKVAPFPQEAPVEVDVVPVQEIRKVTVVWPRMFTNAEDRLAFCLAKPDVYIGTLVGHEGKGSLLSYLKQRGWANGLACQLGTVTDDFACFVVEADLTEEGLKHRRDIISALYSYLALVSAEGVPDHVVRELQTMSDVSWRFQEQGSPGGVAESLAGNMQTYPLPLAISGPRRISTYDATLARSFLASLTPATALVTAVAKDFAPTASLKEKWYGTSYALARLGGAALAWQNAKPLPEFALPRPNPFVPDGPDDLRIKAKRRRKLKPGDPAVPPRPVESDSRWFVNFKQDGVFAQPKTYAYFELISPEVYASPRAVALLKLFELSLDDSLTEYAYEAQVAGLSYSLDFTPKALRLAFGGFNAKMPSFIEAVSSAVATHVPRDAAAFARYKDQVLRELNSFDRQQPYYHASFNAAVATETPRYTVEQVKKEVELAQLSDFPTFLRRCFSRCFGVALLQGNLAQGEVAEYIGPIETAFRFSELPAEERPQRRVVMVDRSPQAGAGAVLQQRTRNKDDNNSATQVMFQIGDRSTQARVLCELLATMLQEPFYDSLRTKQALGYLVFSGLKRVEGVQFLFFAVQGFARDPNYCSDRISEFVESFRATLAAMTEGALGAFIEGLIDSKLQVDQRLAQEAGRNWEEIVGGELRFDRRNEEAAALQRITPVELLAFWDKFVAAGAPERRVLTSQMVAVQHASVLGQPPAGGKLADGDILAFGKGKGLYEKAEAKW